MIHLLAAAIADPGRLDELRYRPEFRKATRNMGMAWLCVQDALDTIQSRVPPPLEGAAMILGSGYGELETTKEFLKTLADSRVARPLLFQNSLHNATLGFLAMRLAFTGITLTVSSRHFTGEDCLCMACDLIERGFCSMAIVTGVDTRVPGFHEALLRAYPPGTSLGEGAACVVVGDDSALERLQVRPLARLREIEYDRAPRAGCPPLSRPYYDSNAIQEVALALKSWPARAPLNIIELTKPDGTRSRIHLQEAAR